MRDRIDATAVSARRGTRWAPCEPTSPTVAWDPQLYSTNSMCDLHLKQTGPYIVPMHLQRTDLAAPCVILLLGCCA
jgi:hypothetical protein